MNQANRSGLGRPELKKLKELKQLKKLKEAKALDVSLGCECQGHALLWLGNLI
jgi:hypothetical protein